MFFISFEKLIFSPSNNKHYYSIAIAYNQHFSIKNNRKISLESQLIVIAFDVAHINFYVKTISRKFLRRNISFNG